MRGKRAERASGSHEHCLFDRHSSTTKDRAPLIGREDLEVYIETMCQIFSFIILYVFGLSSRVASR